MRLDDKAGLLYDYAATQPDGFTRHDACEVLGWNRWEFNQAANRLRKMFAGDSINLVADPDGPSNPWRYKLVGNYDEARPWSVNRIRDMESRLETIEAVSETTTNCTDGRTIEGRKARKIHSTVRFLREQLADINEGGQGHLPGVS